MKKKSEKSLLVPQLYLFRDLDKHLSVKVTCLMVFFFFLIEMMWYSPIPFKQGTAFCMDLI